MKPYKYGEQMSFLTKHFEERETKSNIDEGDEEGNQAEDNRDATADAEEDGSIGSEVSVPEPTTQTRTVHDLINEINAAPPGSDLTQIGRKRMQNTPPPEQIPKLKARSKKFCRDMPPQPTAAATLMNYLVSKNERQEEAHPVDAFLGAIAPTLKSLSPYRWHLAKSDIFNIVQKYEGEMLQLRFNETATASGATTPASSGQLSEGNDSYMESFPESCLPHYLTHQYPSTQN